MTRKEKGYAEKDVDRSSKDRHEKVYNLTEDLAQDRLEWQNRIHVTDPNKVGRGFDNDECHFRNSFDFLYFSFFKNVLNFFGFLIDSFPKWNT